MKKLLSVILASLVIAAAGCSGNGGEATTTTTTTTAASTAAETTTTEATATTEVTTAATETKTTTATETETTAETEIAAGGDTDPMSAEIIGTGLIQSGKKGDGFLTYDRSAISEDIAASGMNEKALTKEAVLADFELYGNTTDNIYTFAMISTDGVQEYPSSDSSVFMSVLILDNEGYTITFGTGDKTTLEEVKPYCTAGKYIEYWAYATVSGENQVVLIPFIAGSENSGYYLVRPVLEMLNADVSEMTIPDPVGDDYDIDGNNAAAEKPAEGSAVLNITKVETYDGFTSASITMENKYNVPLIFMGQNITINGAAHDGFTAYFEVPAGETVEDYLWVDGYDLKAGDELEITFELQNAENYDDFGAITFKMTLENTYMSA